MACAQVVANGDVAARIDRDPGLLKPKVVVFGRRPMASRTCEPTTERSPLEQSTFTQTPASRGEKLMHSASSRKSMPSSSRIALIASEMSVSSREIRRGPFSTTVTLAPKRRYIWANSRPI